MSPDKHIEKNLRLPSISIYGIIAKEGNEELSRPLSALAWSGYAAGICICFSVFTLAYLKMYLPHGGGWDLITKFGYVAGFLIVITARLQLFTENTITVILPLLDKLSWRNISRTFKLWGVVFAANMAGTFTIALMLTQFDLVGTGYHDKLVEVSMRAVDHTFAHAFVTGIPAGFLIAVMVWMLPSAKFSAPFIITVMIYLIALGDYSHVVAGSFEAFYVALDGALPWANALGYIAAAGLGNILGGTGIFTLLVYAQVKDEI